MANITTYLIQLTPVSEQARLAQNFFGYFLLAVALFLIVNWIGEHSTDFGYASTTLFEDFDDSLALNFFIRSLTPTVFIVALSAAVVAIGHEDLRLGIYWVVIYYYVGRLLWIFAINKQSLISWPQFIFHSSIGLAAAWLAYESLILPKRSLLPNIDTAGNELWLAIFAFLYAVTNNVKLSSGPGARRRNAFIKGGYDRAVKSYNNLINLRVFDDELRLIVYAILVYEDYCRPPFFRLVENLCFWKKIRTTGIMQVASARTLTDEESVIQGVTILSVSWQKLANKPLDERANDTIASYNKDDVYVKNVKGVMQIIAKRVEPKFLPAYEAICPYDYHN